MMLTSYPASRRASASCQTRRSKGRGRFSTTIRTRRRLPGDAFIARAVDESGSFGDRPGADEVDQHVVPEVAANVIAKILLARGQHDHLRLVEQCCGIVHEQPADMWDGVQ